MHNKPASNNKGKLDTNNAAQVYTKKALRMKKKPQGDSTLTHGKTQMQKSKTHEQRQALTKVDLQIPQLTELACGSYCANRAD